jgi:hypothetical protein
MNRREWLKCVSMLAAGAVAAPSLLATLDAYAAAQRPEASLGFLSPAQHELIAAVADIIIPRSSTPGALDAGVPAFIDQMFASVYSKMEQDRYLESLAQFDRVGGKPFLELDEGKRKGLVVSLHDQALARPDGLASAATFVMMTKKLTMLGFFMSQPGCMQVLQYDPVPGAYLADIPLSEAGNGKAWAVEAKLVL